MSSIGDLRITVADVNYLLGNAGSSKRLHVTRSYNRVRIELLDDNGGCDEIRAIGPHDCLKFAEGMQKALEVTVGW